MFNGTIYTCLEVRQSVDNGKMPENNWKVAESRINGNQICRSGPVARIYALGMKLEYPLIVFMGQRWKFPKTEYLERIQGGRTIMQSGRLFGLSWQELTLDSIAP